MLGPNTTIFLSNLIDKYKYFAENNMLQDSHSFYLTHESQMKHTGMSEHEIRTAKKKLIDLKIVLTYKKGVPAKEYYRIDWEVLVDFITDSKPLQVSVGQDLENLEVKASKISRTIYKETRDKETRDIKLHSLERLKGYKELSMEDRTKYFVPHAKRLASIIKKEKNYKIDKTKIRSWSNEIRKVHETDGVPAKRIREVLEWYGENIGGQFIPVVYSGAAFRNKFLALEEAIKRSKQPKPTNGQPNRIGYRSLPKDYKYRDDGEI